VSAECVADAGDECIGIVLSDHRHHARRVPRRIYSLVARGLFVLAGALAGASQTTTGPCLFALVTALDRQGQRGSVPRTGVVGLARNE
jgi:hypothetical protein